MSEPIDLAYLVRHYDGAYDINMRRRRYYAIRRDDGTVLDADSAEEMLEKIREDYAAHPVPPRSATLPVPARGLAGARGYRTRGRRAQAMPTALAASAPSGRSQAPGRNATHCPGWPLPAQRT